MNILVLGLGQSLRGDDAVGLEAVCAWKEKYPHTAGHVRVEICELPGLALLDFLVRTDKAILVDALKSTLPVGSLLRVGPENLASFTPEAHFAHGWGVAETLQMGRALYPALKALHVILIGIVGHEFNLGSGLSPGVHIALVNAVEMIEQEVRNLL